MNYDKLIWFFALFFVGLLILVAMIIFIFFLFFDFNYEYFSLFFKVGAVLGFISLSFVYLGLMKSIWSD